MRPPVLHAFCNASKIFYNLQRTRCPASVASKFWQNKHSCFLKHSAVMIWRLCLDRISSGKNILVRFSSFSCDSRIFFVHPTLFLSRETNLSASFQYSNVYDSCSGSGYSSSNLENICLWFVPRVRLYRQKFRENMAWTRNSPTVASIEASVDQNVNDQLEKIIRSSVAIRARFFYIFFLEWDGFVIDMNHSVNFWSMDFSLMRPQLKIWLIFEFALSVTQR